MGHHITDPQSISAMAVKSLACEICGVIFPSRNKLFTHVRNSHNPLADEFQHLFFQHLQGQDIGIDYSQYKARETECSQQVDSIPHSDLVKPLISEELNKYGCKLSGESPLTNVEIDADSDHLKAYHSADMHQIHEIDSSGSREKKRVKKGNNNGDHEPIFDIKTAYEDYHIKVIIKPQGLATMGEMPCLFRHDSLLLPGSDNPAMSYKKAIPCHRLDKATGGLVVCSKSWNDEVAIRKNFSLKTARKRYRSIAIGKIEMAGDFVSNYGKIDHNVDGKSAVTYFKVVSYTNSAVYGCLTTLDLWPITGRNHQVSFNDLGCLMSCNNCLTFPFKPGRLQIRKHLQSIGHPILGDELYTYSADWPTSINKLCLWAVELAMPHPKYLLELDDSNLVEGSFKESDIDDCNDDDDEEDDDDVIELIEQRKSQAQNNFKAKQLSREDEVINRIGSDTINDNKIRKTEGVDRGGSEDIADKRGKDGKKSKKSARTRSDITRDHKMTFATVSSEEFMQEVDQLFVQRTLKALKCDIAGINQTELDSLIQKKSLRVCIDEPPVYEQIRYTHDVHYHLNEERSKNCHS